MEGASMDCETDSAKRLPPDADSTGVLRVSSGWRQATLEMKSEINAWQARIDAAKLQMYLGARGARDRLPQHVERLQQDLAHASAVWEQLEKSSEGDRKDTQHCLRSSLMAVQRSFENAKKYLDSSDDG